MAVALRGPETIVAMTAEPMGDATDLAAAACLRLAIGLPHQLVRPILERRAHMERFVRCEKCDEWKEDCAKCGFCMAVWCASCSKPCNDCKILHCADHLHWCRANHLCVEMPHKICYGCRLVCRECDVVICGYHAIACEQKDCEAAWCDDHHHIALDACGACDKMLCPGHSVPNAEFRRVCPDCDLRVVFRDVRLDRDTK